MPVEESLESMSLQSPSTTKSARAKPTLNMQQSLSDSWDDAAEDSPSETEKHADLATTPVARSHPSAPPPTPMSPRFASKSSAAAATHLDALDPSRYHPKSSLSPSAEDQARPEKTTATASRMIAAGLGVKTPKRSEEQKDYDRAVRENERRRREKERNEKKKIEEDRERARAQMWDD